MRKTQRRMLCIALSILCLGIYTLAGAEAPIWFDTDVPAEAGGDQSITAEQIVQPSPPPLTDSIRDIPANPTAAPSGYYVLLLDAAGMVFDQQYVMTGAYAMMPDVQPQMTGHQFAYWFNAADKEMTPFAFDQPITSDTVLVACFEKDLSGVSIDAQRNETESILFGILGTDGLQASDGQGNVMDPAYAQTLVDAILEQVGAGDPVPPAAAVATPEPVPTEAAAYDALSILDAGGGAPTEMTQATTITPEVAVDYVLQGDTPETLTVTLRANVLNAPEGAVIRYQWQNNATGTFVDVPGATCPTFSYPAYGYVAQDCQWNVIVQIENH